MRRFLKWLYPGMGIKRWWSSCAAGLIIFGVGFHLLLTSGDTAGMRAVGILALIGGAVLEFYALGRLSHSLLGVFLPGGGQKFVDILFKKTQLRKGPRITAIGGGSGLSVLLQGLKKHSSNLTAVVTVADDGGSSGQLRKDFGLPPPGDIRNCLVSLADAEPLMRRLFQYRFESNSPLSGHSFGNLFIVAMTKVTGDFEKAVEASSAVLAIRGKVVPSTLRNVSLCARYKDGVIVRGEEKISHREEDIEQIMLEPGGCRPTEAALEAVKKCDAIVFGPGSLYTSIIPNLLVEGMAEAIAASPAVKIYVCNIMTQEAETRGYRASRHVEALLKHAGTGCIDYVICNTGRIPSRLAHRYRDENATPVEVDAARMRGHGYRVVEEDVVSGRDYVRHDPDRLAEIILHLIELKERETRKHGKRKNTQWQNR